MAKVLIVDDDKNLRKILVNELSNGGHDVEGADSGTKAMDLLEKDDYDVLILDLNMPGLSGMDALKRIKTSEISVEVIILTAHGTMATAVEAMKLGAYDFLTKPFDTEELTATVEKASEKKALRHENLLLRTQLKRQAEPRKIITNSPPMLEVLESMKKLALSDFPVLISGESGVGKELIAKAIHDASSRCDGPFIPINCGAIPENMMESEIFGHEKGAFTGAYARKLGLLEVAHHGTLFLDEIGELTTQLQGKLLRVIETGSFFRVGGIKEVRVDIKFLSAINRDIKTEVEKGSFRADLYYRISTLTVSVPPLRERKEDIPLLVNHFINNDHLHFKNKAFSKEALEVLSGYAWPGNVRELQNTVHRALLLSKGNIIEPNDLPTELVVNNTAPGKRLEDVVREHILRILKEAGGHKGKTAEILDVDPKTLYNKLSSYGVT